MMVNHCDCFATLGTNKEATIYITHHLTVCPTSGLSKHISIRDIREGLTCTAQNDTLLYKKVTL